MPGVGAGPGDWKQRARRAEAEAAVTHAHLRSVQMKAEARAALLERQLEEVMSSTSWRVTKPIRELMLRLRHRRSRGE
jgi:uncharacterized membrane protein